MQPKPKKYFDEEYLEVKESKTYEKMPYSEQLKQKQQLIEKLFLSYKVEPIISNPKPRGYRHKAVLSAVNKKVSDKKYKVQLGLYEEGTKKIIPNLNHFIHDENINQIFVTVEKILQKYKIKAFHYNDRNGLLLHVLIRKSYHYDEVMIVFVTMGYILPNHKAMINEIIALHPNVKTVVQNIHEKETPIVLLDKEKVLYGSGYIKDKIDNLEFRLSAKAFYQVNPIQMINLYNTALKMAKITKNDIVLDTYSGIGTISLLAAKQAREVIAVEINKAAVADALANKKLNNIDNVNFICSDVAEFMVNFNQKVDVLLMDPARDGASIAFLDAIKQLKPKRIVYISCNPYTQIRDVRMLADSYQVEKIVPVDMFSYTAHIENIVLLELKK